MRTRNGDITVRLNRWDDDCRSLRVCGKFPGRRREIEIGVTQSISLRTRKPEMPMINWPAIGAVTRKEVRLFSEMLRVSGVVAESMALVIDWYWPEGKGWKYGQAVEIKSEGPGGRLKLRKQTSRPPSQRCPY